MMEQTAVLQGAGTQETELVVVVVREETGLTGREETGLWATEWHTELRATELQRTGEQETESQGTGDWTAN